MAKPIAVKLDDWKQQFTLDPPDAGGAAQLVISSQPSSTCTAEGKPIWISPIQFTISNYMDGSKINVPASGSTVAPGAIQSTATKVKADGQLVMLEGDKVQVVVLGQKNSGSSTVPATCDVTVTINAAGQASVTGV